MWCEPEGSDRPVGTSILFLCGGLPRSNPGSGWGCTSPHGVSKRKLNIDLVVGDNRTLRPSVLDEIHDTVLFESFQILRNLLDVPIDQPCSLADTGGLVLCDRVEQVDGSRRKYLRQLVGSFEAQAALVENGLAGSAG